MHYNDFQKIVIVGAPRSGTNMLRDVLTSVSGYETWPCDEINFIWRYGNARFDHDELQPELLNQEIVSYIRRQFLRLAEKNDAQSVVEKTCANSLRVDFVNDILPDAKFILIVRDGRDAVASAIQRWKAGLEPLYILRKARYVPVRDVPVYMKAFIRNRLVRITHPEKRLEFWGPRLRGMSDLLERHTLTEVCAYQWRICVEKASQQLSKLEQHRIHRIKYEEFVSDPMNQLGRIFEFLGISIPAEPALVSHVKSSSVGRYRHSLTESQIEAVESISMDTLSEHGYSV